MGLISTDIYARISLISLLSLKLVAPINLWGIFNFWKWSSILRDWALTLYITAICSLEKPSDKSFTTCSETKAASLGGFWQVTISTKEPSGLSVHNSLSNLILLLAIKESAADKIDFVER